MKFAISLALPLFLLITGCASGPSFTDAPPPTSQQALVYLIKGDILRGKSTFSVNNVRVVSMRDEKFSWFTAPPGEYEIKVWERMQKGISIKMPLEAGKTYYIGYSEAQVDSRTSRITLKQLERAAAEARMNEYDYKEIRRPPVL